jgi:hypothetical protein
LADSCTNRQCGERSLENAGGVAGVLRQDHVLFHCTTWYALWRHAATMNSIEPQRPMVAVPTGAGRRWHVSA